MSGVYGIGVPQWGVLTVNCANGIIVTPWYEMPKLFPYALTFGFEIVTGSGTCNIHYEVGGVTFNSSAINGAANAASNFSYPVDRVRIHAFWTTNDQFVVRFLAPGIVTRSIDFRGNDP